MQGTRRPVCQWHRRLDVANRVEVFFPAGWGCGQVGPKQGWQTTTAGRCCAIKFSAHVTRSEILHTLLCVDCLRVPVSNQQLLWNYSQTDGCIFFLPHVFMPVCNPNAGQAGSPNPRRPGCRIRWSKAEKAPRSTVFTDWAARAID